MRQYLLVITMLLTATLLLGCTAQQWQGTQRGLAVAGAVTAVAAVAALSQPVYYYQPVYQPVYVPVYVPRCRGWGIYRQCY